MPRDRPEAAGAVQHPWLTSSLSKADTPAQPTRMHEEVFIQPITEPVEPDTRVDTASVAKKVTATMQALATLALAFAFASYIGFGATAIYGEESKNPARTG